MVSVVLALSAQCACAQGAVQQTAMQSSPTTLAAIQERLSSAESPASPRYAHDAEGFSTSDMLLAMVAGLVLVALQLRRQQKAQSETRITNLHDRLNNIERFSVRIARRVTAEPAMSQAAEAELIAHAERG